MITTLSPEEVRPITLVGANTFHGGAEKVARQLDLFDRVDDVYSKAFADTIVVAHAGASRLDTGAATSLNHAGLSSTVIPPPSISQLPLYRPVLISSMAPTFIRHGDYIQMTLMPSPSAWCRKMSWIPKREWTIFER